MVLERIRNFYLILTPLSKFIIGLVFVIIIYYLLHPILPEIYSLFLNILPIDKNDGVCGFLETSSFSRDCSVYYEKIENIPVYSHYVTFRGVAYDMQGGYNEFAKYILSVFPENNLEFEIIGDGYKTITVLSNHSTFNSNREYPNITNGNLLEINCFLNPDFKQEPVWLTCGDAIFEAVGPVDNIKEYLKSVTILESQETVEQRFALFSYDEWSIGEIIYRTKINDTHWLDYEIINNKTTLHEKYFYANSRNFSHQYVDESWDYYSNFSFWSYKIIVPNIDLITVSLPVRIYSSERDINFENSEGKSIILSGVGYKNMIYNGPPKATGIIRAELDSELSFYNVIGDGICGELEEIFGSQDCIV